MLRVRWSSSCNAMAPDLVRRKINENRVCPTRLTAERAKPFTSIGLSLIFMAGGESSQKPLKSPVCNILPRIPVRQVGHTQNNMCGIVGAVSLDGVPIDLPALQRMNDLQAHRGPDGEGFMLGWIKDGAFKHSFAQGAGRLNSDAPARVGLGHRRLAIIDLSDRGLQPMSSNDGSTWIVFNGEIYNFQELRSELESRGYSFKTGTDTEVLLQSYLHWGEDCLDRLQGMYGFAIWDGRRGRLFCARDRLGIKPFYYATPKGCFVFASEIKGLLPFPGVEVEADDDAVVGFLVHGNCDYGERTILKGVKALPAGHALTLDVATARLEIKRYWSLKPGHDSGASASPTGAANMDDERVAALRDRLLDTMRRHLISDVRAGSCL